MNSLKVSSDVLAHEFSLLPKVIQNTIYEYADPYKTQFREILNHIKFRLQSCYYNIEYVIRKMEYYEFYNIYFYVTENINISQNEYLEYINKYICDTSEKNIHIKIYRTMISFTVQKKIVNRGYFFYSSVTNISIKLYGYKMYKGMLKFITNKRMLKIKEYINLVDDFNSIPNTKPIPRIWDTEGVIYRTFNIEEFKNIVNITKKIIFRNYLYT